LDRIKSKGKETQMNVLHKQDGFFTEQLDSSDNDLFNAIRSELGRQREEMELIAIQNDCVRVKEDFVNGGYACDDVE